MTFRDDSVALEEVLSFWKKDMVKSKITGDPRVFCKNLINQGETRRAVSHAQHWAAWRAFWRKPKRSCLLRKSADRSTHSFYFYLININFSFGVFLKCVLETKPCSAALALRFRELTGWLAGWLRWTSISMWLTGGGWQEPQTERAPTSQLWWNCKVVVSCGA